MPEEYAIPTVSRIKYQYFYKSVKKGLSNLCHSAWSEPVLLYTSPILLLSRDEDPCSPSVLSCSGKKKVGGGCAPDLNQHPCLHALDADRTETENSLSLTEGS